MIYNYERCVIDAITNLDKSIIINSLKRICNFFESDFFCRFKREGHTNRKVLKNIDAIIIRHYLFAKMYYKNDGLIDDFNRYIERIEYLEYSVIRYYYNYVTQRDTNIKDKIVTIVNIERKSTGL